MAETNGGSSRPKVLCPEKLSVDGLALLRKTIDVDERSGLSPDELIEIIPTYDALLVRSETKVTAQLLAAAKQLKVVARAGVGVDNVDVPAATKLGVIVVNSPSGNIQAAAEHSVALLLSMARNVPDACASLKEGRWERSRLVGVEVKGKTLGIIGLGKVGLIVARMARGLGMQVAAADPYASPAVAEAANVNLVASLGELLPMADFLTIHTPMLASTKGMLSHSELGQLKKGARVLNVARGGIVDEVALLAALDSGHLSGAGIDVFTLEPPNKDPESAAAKLIAHPRCVCTPHLGASTFEAQENVSVDVCEQVLQILAGELPRSAVNAPIILPADHKTLQPFVTLVEKMGSLYTQHFTSPKERAGRTTFDLTYEGEISTISSTKPLFAAFVKGLTSPISEAEGFNVNIVNAELVAKERGIVVNEQKSRDPSTQAFSSLVTVVARPPSRAPSLGPLGHQAAASIADPKTRRPEEKQHIISGYCSDKVPFISRIDRFSTSFKAEGTLLICHNYDSPGKIGVVGDLLGKANVNINYMSVAPASYRGREANIPAAAAAQESSPKESTEALMILGVDREVDQHVLNGLVEGGGVLSVSSAVL
ncbi:MAG: hypothetical protein Q9216_002616 [Gyalolechia sp. 2 TL-2023]